MYYCLNAFVTQQRAASRLGLYLNSLVVGVEEVSLTHENVHILTHPIVGKQATRAARVVRVWVISS